MVNLVTVKDRELMKVGHWQVHQGGEFVVTPELIQAALNAHQAGVLRKPTIRLGHNDPRFTGDPAVGWVDNVRASEDGTTLYGDLVGVPKWLADNMPAAYPSLSIEGMYDYTAPDGTTHDFVLTGLALLGATAPGIGSLKSVQDVEALFGGDTDSADIAAAVGEIGGTPVKFTVQAADKKPYGDVTYADPGYQDDGKKRYPLDTEEHVRAAWSYINQAKNQKPYSAQQLASIKSKIRSAAKKFGIDIQAAAAAQPRKDAVMASLQEKIAERLGLDPSADEDAIEAALNEKLPAVGEQPKPADEQPSADEAPKAEETPKADEAPKAEPVAAAAPGVVQLEKAQYDDLVAAAADGRAARLQQLAEADERTVMAAIAEGKIAPARKKHWLDALKADRDGTKQVLASLAPGLIPVDSEIGYAKAAEAAGGVDAELADKERVLRLITRSPAQKEA